MDTDANPDVAPVEPLLACHRPLHVDDRGQRVAGRAKHAEERITLSGDLKAVAVRDRGPDHLLMTLQNRVVPLLQLRHEARRSLDVREDERERPIRESVHTGTIGDGRQQETAMEHLRGH